MYILVTGVPSKDIMVRAWCHNRELMIRSCQSIPAARYHVGKGVPDAVQASEAPKEEAAGRKRQLTVSWVATEKKGLNAGITGGNYQCC
jgi:hypothetical protein